MIDSSSHGWSSLFWTFHVWYKVMSNIRCIFSTIFFSSLPSSCYKLYVYFRNFSYNTIIQMSSIKRNKQLLVKIVEHKLDEAFSDVIWVVQLGRFILLSVPISQQLPRLTSLYFFSFLNWRLEPDCTIPWQHSGGSEQLFTPQSWKLFPCK